MTKQILVKQLAARTGMKFLDAQFAFENLCTIMAEQFAQGESIYIRGFGTFKVYNTKARTARNITKGSTVTIPPRKRVKFIPGKDLKAELQR